LSPFIALVRKALSDAADAVVAASAVQAATARRREREWIMVDLIG
jgi:hypothetical protein